MPGNAARLFQDYTEALSQPIGQIRFSVEEMIMFGNCAVKNIAYRSELIKYDDKYSTQVAFSEPNFSSIVSIIAKQTPHAKSVYEIGCGQGELLKALHESGVIVAGCDSTTQSKSTYITKGFYDENEEIEADLYILNCVLPH